MIHTSSVRRARQQRRINRDRPKPPRVIAPTITPLPWQAIAMKRRESPLLFAGAAGGGKSVVASEMIHNYMMTYRGAVGMVMRKVRVNAKQSVAKALISRARAAGKYRKTIFYNKTEGVFEYKETGSICYVTGMHGDDQKEAVRSINGDGSVDIVWMEEANAFDEQDLNEVYGRMRGKAGPYTQVILSTNPDHHLHWIKTRLIDGGEATVVNSSYKENYHNPDTYEQMLDLMTKHEKDRLKKGIWSTPTGLIYAEFTREGNVTESAEYDPSRPVWWGVDDGYSPGQKHTDTGGIDPKTGTFAEDAHPRTILFIQQRADGVFIQFDELLMCSTLEEVQIKEALDRPYRRPEYVAIDSSAAQLRNRIQQNGIYVRKSTHLVDEGIKETRSMINPDINGVRRFLIHPRCRHSIAEMGSYMWDIKNPNKPKKAFDHSHDARRYFLWTKRRG